MAFFSDLANKVWDPKSSVDLLQTKIVCVVEEGVELVKQSSLITLPFSGGRRSKQIIQMVAKRQAEITHTYNTLNLIDMYMHQCMSGSRLKQ